MACELHLNKATIYMYTYMYTYVCKEIQPIHSDQPWDFLGRNDAKAETPVFWPRYAKS